MLLIYILLPVLGAVIGYRLGLKDVIFKNPVKGLFQKQIFRLGILIVLLLALFTFCIYLSNQQNQGSMELAKIFFAGLFVIGLIYAIMNYEFHLTKIESDIRFKQSAITLDTIKNWHIDPWVSFSEVIKKFEKSPQSSIIKGDIDDFMKFLNEDKNAEISNALMNMLNYFDTVSTGVNNGLLEPKFTRQFFEPIFLHYYENYCAFIFRKRSNDMNQKLWSEYTHLCQDWISQKTMQKTAGILYT